MTRVVFQPGGHSVEAEEGVTLMQAAREAGLALENQCGGLGTCGKCKVLVLRGRVGPPGPAEMEALSRLELEQGLRLACQTRALGNRVEALVPPRSLVMEQRYQLEGASTAFRPQPPVTRRMVKVDLPALGDARSDLERLRQALTAQGVRLGEPGLDALRKLPETLRGDRGEIQALLRGSRLLDLRPPADRRPLYGLAVDLGTSKIALILTDLESGAAAETAGLMNPQLPFGEDVVSRLDYALRGKGQARRLREIVVEAVNRATRDLCGRAGIRPRDILEVSLVGNTAMHHIFLGLPLRQLAFSPYVPAVSEALDIRAADLGLETLPGAIAHLPAPLAGYVGSDHLAAVLASRLYREKGVCLLADLGTNTELALKTPQGITCCSCASGPAFEGGSLRHGMRAAEGAVEEVRITPEGEIRYSTVGGKEPLGICGSGALEALAAMREAGTVEPGGRIIPGRPGVTKEDDELGFRIARRHVRSGKPRGWVTLSQRDVRELQKAKGAVRAGIEMLLDHAGLTAADLDKVILAGAFGNYLDPASLMEIAMLPPLPLRRIVQVGNAAGVGAREMLCSMRARRRAQRLAAEMRYLELATYPRAELFFASCMLLSEEALQSFLRKWRRP